MPFSTRCARLGALTLVPLFVLVACSGDEQTTGGPSGTPPVTAAPDGADDAGGTGDTADDEAQQTAGPADPATGEAVKLTIVASGDILPHSWVNVSARLYAGSGDRSMYPRDGDTYDYTPMFADVTDLISGADLALCHLETPLSPDGTDLSYPNTLSFNTPREMADALAGAGFDGCDFASNHTMDRGIRGLADTEQVLREVGMGYAGPTAHEGRAGQAEVYEVGTDAGTVQLAHLAYTYTYPNSGEPTTYIPEQAPWLEQAHWPNIGSAGILEQAQTARDKGADFVVVSMHWGEEYQAQPTPQQRQVAQELLGSDTVDLVLGTHVHVIQPCEQINGKHVIYGLGNFLSNQSPTTASSLRPETQEGMVALLTLSRDEQGTVSSSMAYQPTRVEIPPEVAPGHVIRLVSPDTYPESWERTVASVDLLGGCDAEPIQPAP
ncbi:CapA family protein [Ornithinimicrobium pratense]|uniref:CapA family protein n=1 Tax=Ornithinimicrobium pratense TaxID=2593973 RepID=A0A5J6V797_9MICO|nr:CapA family protein [Ornithinimicrobium pratense]QFG68932.1 CapA family protein [Ornithinimicrobium pratense]